MKTRIVLACSVLVAALFHLMPLKAAEISGAQPKVNGQANEAIDRAMASVGTARLRAETDPTRPVYHFRAPANWMNDPNGPIYHNGYYHMFYQHNPYGENWGNMHWGHARSRDLVFWERLPIALWPSKETGEDHVFSGCAVINGQGQPMILYTSIGRGKSATDHAEQWAALGDADLMRWQKHPANPVMSESLHGDLKIYDWRDPFLFQHEGRTYAVLGGNLNRAKGGQAVVNLYQAGNDELTRWKYLGVLFTHPDSKVANIECPNFFKLDERWVLVISPHREVEYFVGTFDPKLLKFDVQQRGSVDYSGHYYAPNCLLDPQGRRIMWGWIRGFKSGSGWNGCLTLPRILNVDSDGQLHQRPIPEMQKLRGNPIDLTDCVLKDSSKLLDARGDTLEIEAVFEPDDGAVVGLKVRHSSDGQRSLLISFDGEQLKIGATTAPFTFHHGEKTLKLHVFLDKSVVEVFANDRACLTRVIDAKSEDLNVEVFAQKGRATIRSLTVWPLRPIW